MAEQQPTQPMRWALTDDLTQPLHGDRAEGEEGGEGKGRVRRGEGEAEANCS